MSRIDIPQWVIQSFVRSAVAVGATVDAKDITAVCTHLVELWSGQERRFHNTQHLFDLLTRINTLASEAHNAELVRLAAWGHGIVFSSADKDVYVRNGGEDRSASADLAAQIYRSLGIDPATCQAIRTMILSMRTRPTSMTDTGVIEPIDMDLMVLIDAHLGFLANQPQKYRKYMTAVREEYAHIPDERFFTARLDIVTRLLARKALFSTPLAKQWEQLARENLTSEQKRLECELRKLANSSTGEMPRVVDNGEAVRNQDSLSPTFTSVDCACISGASAPESAASAAEAPYSSAVGADSHPLADAPHLAGLSADAPHPVAHTDFPLATGTASHSVSPGMDSSSAMANPTVPTPGMADPAPDPNTFTVEGQEASLARMNGVAIPYAQADPAASTAGQGIAGSTEIFSSSSGSSVDTPSYESCGEPSVEDVPSPAAPIQQPRAVRINPPTAPTPPLPDPVTADPVIADSAVSLAAPTSQHAHGGVPSVPAAQPEGELERAASGQPPFGAYSAGSASEAPGAPQTHGSAGTAAASPASTGSSDPALSSDFAASFGGQGSSGSTDSPSSIDDPVPARSSDPAPSSDLGLAAQADSSANSAEFSTGFPASAGSTAEARPASSPVNPNATGFYPPTSSAATQGSAPANVSEPHPIAPQDGWAAGTPAHASVNTDHSSLENAARSLENAENLPATADSPMPLADFIDDLDDDDDDDVPVIQRDDENELWSTPGAAPSQIHLGRSSLESLNDDFEPGIPDRPLTPEEARQARRNEIAREARMRVGKVQSEKADRHPKPESLIRDDLPPGFIE
ncbi:hypothetical protein [Trueperella sp. LYQ141]|uniref:hypothetical protein n=1 Tax=Trueperella sp. LYQ141 TaxID=3391058 RepID=UPI0039835A2F